ncbi:MAG: hypothetical protein ACI9J2_001380 [Saprospiraceae bacterium]|jgi:hypothetical protein
MQFPKLISIVLFSAVALTSVVSFAASQLNFAVKQNDQLDTLSFYVRGHQVLIGRSAEGRNGVLFDANIKSLIILDHVKKTYSKLDHASLSEIAKMVESIGTIAKSQGGVLGDLFSSLGLDSELGESDDIVLIDKNEVITIAGIACQVKEVRKAEVLQTRLCVSDSLPLNEQEAKTLRELTQFAQSLTLQAGSLLERFGLAIPVFPQGSFESYIIGVDTFDESKLKARLTEIKDTQLLDEDFTIPVGYLEKSLPI